MMVAAMKDFSNNFDSVYTSAKCQSVKMPNLTQQQKSQRNQDAYNG